ncbi:cytochrome P450 [Planomonospora parontospora]|uniref:cytochrome P450 n=1 Tax=Planomonospora parontospora TaxID=58119 RepID=UPI00166FA81E|nr:cytochrome P450 [Planomonospora parontospora]GGL53669.1 cytochrome P450 [Planomonospora parontospora subsp. antibiotica]GII19590.1 cytochrome P450 [Planomonospora parontospora subsp. antibiotica]
MTDSTGPSDNGSEPRPFPMDRGTCPFSPPPEYAGMRAAGAPAKVRLRWSGKEVWAVSRHEDVRQVLSDSTMSSNWKLPAYPLQVPVPDEMLQQLELPLVAMDPPEHSARRRILIPELTARRAQALRPRIQEIVDEHIGAMLAQGGPVDLIQALAFPVPALIFCELLGVPAADSDFFRRVAETLVRSDVEQEEMISAQIEMEAYLDKLVAEKEGSPGDDVISRIIVKNRETPTIERRDILNLAKNLLFGGFDTTSNMIALGVLVLLEHPEQLAELRSDPGLAPGAVEELLRYLSIADSSPARAVLQDVEIGGTLIRAGEGVVALTSSANRDENVFPDPDRFDIHRDTFGHSAFGHGIHQCPGANIVRVELEVVFTTLFARIPELRLAVPREEVSFKSHTLVHGVNGELPVTW